jgi:hypothetical protein
MDREALTAKRTVTKGRNNSLPTEQHLETEPPPQNKKRHVADIL